MPGKPRQPKAKSIRSPQAPAIGGERQVTTLWEAPSQDYHGPRGQSHGDKGYVGATPAWVIRECVERFSKPKDLVIDPMAGSGTTLDVARELGRRASGYDVAPTRSDIYRVDARELPMDLNGKVQLVFVDPPYSTHIEYSDDRRCIGRLDALEQSAENPYFSAMQQVIASCARILKVGGHLCIYVSDSIRSDRSQRGKETMPVRFAPIGFRLFAMAEAILVPLDIVSVVRKNEKLKRGNFRRAADEQGFLLRGFNYLMIFRKDDVTASS